MKFQSLSKYSFFLIFFLIILLITSLALLMVQKKKCLQLHCLEMKGLNQFQVKEVYQNDKNIYRALLSKNDDLLRVEVHYNTLPNVASQSLQAEVTKMKALFENAPAPYPGMISDEIQCDKKFKPVYRTENINGLPIHSFDGFLNDRLVFGACTENQAIYRGLMALFYCPDQKQVYTLELIAPNNQAGANNDYFEDLSSLKCRTKSIPL